MCFIEFDEDSGLKNYLKKFEDSGFEIHVFNNLNLNNIKPHNIQDILDYYFKNEYNNNFYLLSDVEDFLKLSYRIYSKCFKCFIYWRFQEDMLAIAELCDIYVNPPRAGGQTSAAEAMYKGLPVVSLNYGDVSICIGKENCVDGLKKIYAAVLKLVKDKNFYSKVSQEMEESS